MYYSYVDFKIGQNPHGYHGADFADSERYGIVDASVRSSAAIVQLSGIIAMGQLNGAMVRVRATSTTSGF